MAQLVLKLSVISVVCGAAMSISPEGGYKNICRILCTSILILCILSSLQEHRIVDYTDMSRYIEHARQSFLENTGEIEKNLTKQVMTARLEEYILEKAHGEGIDDLSVCVEVRLNDENIWLPACVELSGIYTQAQKRSLSEIIHKDLGISTDEQYWLDKAQDE